MTGLRHVPANHMAPAQYSQLAWAVMFGAVFFAEVPDAVGFVGLVLIGASGVVLLERQRRVDDKRGIEISLPKA